jgi:hypothetical protein
VTSQITRNSPKRNKSHVRNNSIKIAFRKAQFEEIKQNTSNFKRLIMSSGIYDSVMGRITFHVMCDVIQSINQ